MTPTRKWPSYLSTPVQLVVKVVLGVGLLCLIGGTAWSFLLQLAFLLAINCVVDYLWCPANDRKAFRTIPAGDPRPWQVWRWMDIYGPSGHENAGHQDLYLRRLYVLRTPWFGVMLHWIKREDWDRDALHNHPWEFRRFIVSGGYTEELAYPQGELDEAADKYVYTELKPSTLKTHRMWSFSKFPSGAYHRITSVKPHTVSLVINGPKCNSWGFFVPGQGHVGWRDYVNGAR